jgi:hypothetical protein
MNILPLLFASLESDDNTTPLAPAYELVVVVAAEPPPPVLATPG